MSNSDVKLSPAKRFDERPDKQQLNSLLLGEIAQKRTDFQTSDTRSLCEIMKETRLSDEEFDSVRDTTEYKEILNMI